MCEIYSELIINTSERRQLCQLRQLRRSGVFIVNFEQILNIVLVFPLQTLKKYMPAASQKEFGIRWMSIERKSILTVRIIN